MKKYKQLCNSLFLFSLLIVSPLSSNEDISLTWLEDKPRSITKDFYIWQFLQQDITSEEAALALGEAKNVNHTLFTLYAKKFNHDETYAVVECMNATAVDLLQTSSDCLTLGLSPNKIITLNYQEKKQAAEKLKETYPLKADMIKILNAPLPFTKLLAAQPELFFEIFNKINVTFIETYLNYKIPLNTLNKLASYPQFNQTIQRIIANNNLTNLQEALLLELDTSKLESQSLFFLALNALKYEQKELALEYLDKAQKKAYFRKDQDKILFWRYKITQQNEFLEDLSNSYDINLYSLYAKEQLNKKAENIIYDFRNNKKSEDSPFDTKNPFTWLEQLIDPLKSSSEYEALFTTKETLPHLAYMNEKISKYQIFYYITPYKEYLKNYDVKRQALMYALAKKESHFIPTAVSSSYALGVMQIMPFLSKNIAKELNEPYVLQEQFNPQTNIRYAFHHLNYLEKHLVNPLFIAYAYNGGIGFMRRTLEKGFMQMKSPYEPFLSMELMSNEESREYGKQVLANYYIYINYLDKKNPTKLSTLLENLQHNFPK